MAEKRKKLQLRDYVGRKVRTLRELRNSLCSIPKGTVCTVTSTWRSGVMLRGEACRKCGVEVYIAQVHRDAVELVS